MNALRGNGVPLIVERTVFFHSLSLSLRPSPPPRPPFPSCRFKFEFKTHGYASFIRNYELGHLWPICKKSAACKNQTVLRFFVEHPETRGKKSSTRTKLFISVISAACLSWNFWFQRFSPPPCHIRSDFSLNRMIPGSPVETTDTRLCTGCFRMFGRYFNCVHGGERNDTGEPRIYCDTILHTELYHITDQTQYTRAGKQKPRASQM